MLKPEEGIRHLLCHSPSLGQSLTEPGAQLASSEPLGALSLPVTVLERHACAWPLPAFYTGTPDSGAQACVAGALSHWASRPSVLAGCLFSEITSVGLVLQPSKLICLDSGLFYTSTVLRRVKI